MLTTQHRDDAKFMVTFEKINGESEADYFYLETDYSILKQKFRHRFNIHDDNVELYRGGKIINNMTEIESGNHYKLSYDLASVISYFIQEIGSDDPKKCMFLLQSKMSNSEFLLGFIKRGGLSVLMDRITRLDGNTLGYALNSLSMGIEYGIKMEWDSTFINRLIGIVNDDTSLVNLSKPATKLLCLMLEDDFTNEKVGKILDKCSLFPKLVARLGYDSDYVLHVNTSRLICDIVRSTKDDLKRSTQIYDLDDLGFRGFLLKQIRNNHSNDLQTYIKEFEILLRKEFHRRCKMKILKSNSLHIRAIDQILLKFQKVLKLRNLSWEDLGVEDPFQEFEYVGVLGLECLYYAVKKDASIFEKVFQSQLLAKKENICPILRAASQVVFVLSNYWGLFYEDYHHIDSTQSYFLHFENVFILSINSFFTIWNHMNCINDVNSGDLENATHIFKDHFYRKMSLIETCSKNFSEIEAILNDVDFEKIQKDIIDDFVQRKGPKFLNDEAQAAIRNQRITCLKRGSWFSINNLKSEKHRCYRLSDDQQYLYFQDYQEELSTIPSIDEFHSFVRIEDIHNISLNSMEAKSKSFFQFSISGFSHDDMKEFELIFRTNSSYQSVEWYEGLGLMVKNKLLESNIPYNGRMLKSILNDVQSCVTTSAPITPSSLPTELPSLDFFYSENTFS